MTLFSGTGGIFVSMNDFNLFTKMEVAILEGLLDSLLIVKGYLFNSPDTA